MGFHESITDPEIHEPKGISSSKFGEVYVSNGLGSGFWTGVNGITGLQLKEGSTGVQGITGMSFPTSYLTGSHIPALGNAPAGVTGLSWGWVEVVMTDGIVLAIPGWKVWT